MALVLNFKKFLRKNNSALIFFRRIYSFYKYLDLYFLPKSKNNKQTDSLLFSTFLGGEISPVRLESLISVKMNDLGFKSSFLLCDGCLEACQLFKYNSYGDNIDWLANDKRLKQEMCKNCFHAGKKALSRHGEVIQLSHLLTDAKNLEFKYFQEINDFKELINLKYNEIPIGEEGLAAYLRYYCVAEYIDNELSRKILVKYIYSAYIVAVAMDRLLKNKPFDGLICNHGVYVPNGVVVRVAKQRKIPVIVWNLSYRKGTFLFSNGDTYHREMICDDWWDKFTFNKKEQNIIKDYLITRRTGSNDWLSFQRNQIDDPEIEDLRIKVNQYDKVYCMLTNVLWDAQIHFQENLFNNMLDWVFSTIDFINEYKPNCFLFIRVHPAEDRGVIPTRQRVADEISKKYGNLPENIMLIESSSNITSYQCADLSDVILIYGTKMGAEIAPSGKPVIVAGDAWVRGKGFTFDPKTEREYFVLLSSELKMDKDMLFRANKYAYYFFYKRCIEIPFLKYRKVYPPFRIPLSLINSKKLVKDKGLVEISQNIKHYVRNPSNNRPKGH